jgi:two-component system alkaline phosphatase synthesis response regulator PhoP
MHETAPPVPKERVLVVEDEEELAELIRLHLEQSGYQVDIAPDGLTALRRFDEQRPALIVLDLGVPQVSGYRLMWLFKRGGSDVAEPRPKVIIVTARDFEEAREVVRLGADDFLTKPFDPQDLVRRVDYLLHSA